VILQRNSYLFGILYFQVTGESFDSYDSCHVTLAKYVKGFLNVRTVKFSFMEL